MHERETGTDHAVPGDGEALSLNKRTVTLALIQVEIQDAQVWL